MTHLIRNIFLLGLLICPSAIAQHRIIGRRVYSQPAPVYSQPAPVYSQPAPVYSAPIHSSPVVVAGPTVVASPAVVASDPFSVCNCIGVPGGSDCNCKNLDCRIRLPHGCKKSKPPYKEPIPCRIVGTIPKKDYTINCSEKIADFFARTNVPEIHCTTEFCEEIGKKRIQCIPGCYFSVCIPINKCKTETIECKLVPKNMKMEVWKRKDKNQGTVYDVYVINVAPNIAGGMPECWLVLHCASANQFRQRFPNATRPDGTPLVKNVPKDAKPQKTTADVSIEMTVKKALVEHYAKQAEQLNATEDQSTTDNANSETQLDAADERRIELDGDIAAAIEQTFAESPKDIASKTELDHDVAKEG